MFDEWATLLLWDNQLEGTRQNIKGTYNNTPQTLGAYNPK